MRVFLIHDLSLSVMALILILLNDVLRLLIGGRLDCELLDSYCLLVGFIDEKEC